MRRAMQFTLIALLFMLPGTAAAQSTGSKMTEAMSTMTMDVQKSLARRSLELWSSRSQDDPSEIFTADYVNYQEPLAAGGVKSIGLATWKTVVAANHKAFPDLTVVVLMQVGEGDSVATHWRFSATQTGTYEGLAPTGKAVSWTGMQIDRFENGRIRESWVSWDKYTMFEELGLIESK